jgi:hypothetical protein
MVTVTEKLVDGWLDARVWVSCGMMQSCGLSFIKFIIGGIYQICTDEISQNTTLLL